LKIQKCEFFALLHTFSQTYDALKFKGQQSQNAVTGQILILQQKQKTTFSNVGVALLSFYDAFKMQ